LTHFGLSRVFCRLGFAYREVIKPVWTQPVGGGTVRYRFDLKEMKMSFVRNIVRALVAYVCILPMAASAQSFPDRAVHVLLPFPAGTGPDVVMRKVGERLTQIWKQPVIIENRPGGNRFIAMTAAKRAPADGYNLVMVDYAIVSVLPHLFPKTIPFDSQKDFDAVAPMYTAYWFIAVPGDSKFRNVADLLAEAKAKQGAYTYGSSGVGSPMHLQAAMFENVTGTHMNHIPYKETPQIIVDVSRGEVGWAFTTGATAGALLKAKKVKFLAVGAPARHPAFPDVPTIAEAGGPANLDFRTWVALFAPHGVPKPVLDKLNADISAVLAAPEIRDELISMGLEASPGSAAGLSKLLADDLKKYGDLASHLKISLD
jgi:tripartite-type tricarboxylate transporter receptor subunit TctC